MGIAENQVGGEPGVFLIHCTFILDGFPAALLVFQYFPKSCRECVNRSCVYYGPQPVTVFVQLQAEV